MRIALKLTLAILALVVAILAVEARLRSVREAELYEADLRKNQHVLGRALAGIAELVFRRDGFEPMRDLVHRSQVTVEEIHARLVDLTPGSLEGPRTTLPPDLLDRLRHGEEVVQMAARRHPRILYTFVPLELGSERSAALELSTSMRGEEEYLRATTFRFLLVGAGVLVVSALAAAWLGSRMVGQPVSGLVQQARRIGSGDFERAPARHRRDELGELGEALDTMADSLREARRRLDEETHARLRATEQLHHADRLAAVGTLGAGLAHELGTPLHVVQGRAKLALRRATDAAVRHDLEIIAEECQRMTKIVRELLTFARRSPTTERTRLNVRTVVTRAASLIEPLARTRGMNLTVQEAGDVWISAERDKIEQVMTNLLINAVHAMSAGDTVTVRWEARTDPPRAPGEDPPAGPWVCLFVEDEGTGIAEEIMERILDPFFTTKEVGQGVGLGLSIAHGIVRDHGGHLQVHNRQPRGACFQVWLPQVE